MRAGGLTERLRGRVGHAVNFPSVSVFISIFASPFDQTFLSPRVP